MEDHRNQQLDEILEEKHVLQFIQDGAERQSGAVAQFLVVAIGGIQMKE